MNAGEPPDETGESGADEGARDPEIDDDESDALDADSQEGADGSGDDLDPAQEVEAAVEEVMGPGALDDGEDDETGGDERVEDDATDDDDDVSSEESGAETESPDDPPTDEEEPTPDDDADETAAVEAARELVDTGETEERTETGESDAPMEVDETDAPTEGEGMEDPAEGEGVEDKAEAEGVEGPTDAEAAGATDSSDANGGGVPDPDAVEEPADDVPADVRKYDRFKKIDGGTYDRANEFLRDRTYITAREWAMARLCADFRTETGVEMTKIGENLPELVPFMTDTYTPQAVNQARAAFEEKVRKAGATFLYGAMCDFFTAEELDDVMYEATEVAKFLLEVEGVELSVEEELAAEDHISEVMRDVREHSAALRHDEVTCPECGHEIHADD